MKKFLLLAILLFMSACATTTYHPKLTLDNVSNECRPDKQWNMRVMGVGVFVVVYNDCYTHKKLLVIPVEKNPDLSENVSDLTGKLVLEHFIAYISRTEPEHNWSVKVLKKEDAEGVVVLFYELIGTKISKE